MLPWRSRTAAIRSFVKARYGFWSDPGLTASSMLSATSTSGRFLRSGSTPPWSKSHRANGSNGDSAPWYLRGACMKRNGWPRERIRKLQDLLLDWYERHRRELPWRSHPSPYRVWISETMLQQTQVQTVLPYYERFLRRFPDIRTLAEAPEQDVLAAWAGLGYYRADTHLQ